MNSIKLLSFLLLLSFSTCESCKEEEEWTTLPPETQTGANTFGCYVNGELFVKRKYLLMTPNPLTAYFDRESKYLFIQCFSQNSEIMGLKIDNFPGTKNNTLSLGYYTPKGSRDCYLFACNNCEQIFLTKFDTVNRIVSGTFEFNGRCGDLRGGLYTIIFTGDSILHITKGRFDIKLNIQ